VFLEKVNEIFLFNLTYIIYKNIFLIFYISFLGFTILIVIINIYKFIMLIFIYLYKYINFQLMVNVIHCINTLNYCVSILKNIINY